MKQFVCIEIGSAGCWMKDTLKEAEEQAKRNLDQWPMKQYLVGKLTIFYSRTLGPITSEELQ